MTESEIIEQAYRDMLERMAAYTRLMRGGA